MRLEGRDETAAKKQHIELLSRSKDKAIPPNDDRSYQFLGGMRPSVDQLCIFNGEDSGAMTDRGQTMRHDDHGPLPLKIANRLHHSIFRLSV